MKQQKTTTREQCSHNRAKHGPGSANCWMQCADCGLSLGIAVPVAAILDRIEDANKTLVEAKKWEEWKAKHPEATPPPKPEKKPDDTCANCGARRDHNRHHAFAPLTRDCCIFKRQTPEP